MYKNLHSFQNLVLQKLHRQLQTPGVVCNCRSFTLCLVYASKLGGVDRLDLLFLISGQNGNADKENAASTFQRNWPHPPPSSWRHEIWPPMHHWYRHTALVRKRLGKGVLQVDLQRSENRSLWAFIVKSRSYFFSEYLQSLLPLQKKKNIYIYMQLICYDILNLKNKARREN